MVATPGRLLDHMREPWFRIDRLEVLVLDEADRMLDMGFLPDIKRILARLPERRQTMLFSATLPGPIVELSRGMLTDPVRLDVARRAVPPTAVRQSVMPVPEQLKTGPAARHARGGTCGPRSCSPAPSTAPTASPSSWTASPASRATASTATAPSPSGSPPWRPSRAARIRVLVATDVASRGIDVEALPHVINFDVPGQPDDYVHRVGRTARASASGDALTFVSPTEEASLRAIERTVGRRIERRPIGGFNLSAPSEGARGPVGELTVRGERGGRQADAGRHHRRPRGRGRTNAHSTGLRARRASRPTASK